jgi:hypothetical protein
VQLGPIARHGGPDQEPPRLESLRKIPQYRWPQTSPPLSPRLSNHVPELPEILNNLGLAEQLLEVFNSAESGYEKPHPRAFDGVLETVAGAEAAWMVGDSLATDVRGAEAGACRLSSSAARSAARDTTARTCTG